MAEEAFALSPISARAAQPGEEDYAAISEAFMETSRGRWFLGEYAKRNRNADTSMVLDAVARIEQSLAGQRQAVAEVSEQALSDAAAQAVTQALAEALSAIRSAVGSAQASATEALDALAFEQKLAPVRKGARVIREIAWRLREIGNDARICDLIDSQVAVIEAGVGAISSDEAKAALRAAFASLAARLAEFGDDEAPAPVAEGAMAEDVIENLISGTEAASPAPTAQPTAPVAAAGTIEAPPVEVADVIDPDADAHDEAVLDLIATEMGALDDFEIDDTAAMIVEEAHIADLAPAAPDIAAELPKPVIAEPAKPPAEMPVPAAIEAVPEPAVEISLGSSLIASGLVRKPKVAANDPLAPIRRMSQAEKIAFFS